MINKVIQESSEIAEEISQQAKYLLANISELLTPGLLIEATDSYGTVKKGFYTGIDLYFNTYTNRFSIRLCMKKIKRDGTPSQIDNNVLRPTNIKVL